MKWETKEFGLGPERITNEWLNGLQDYVLSNRQVLKSFHAGVVWGCEPSFVDGDPLKVKVKQGAVISDGAYCEIPATEISISDTDATDSDYIWVYVDPSGEVKLVIHADPTPWPSDSDLMPPLVDDVEFNIAVLGVGQIKTINVEWSWGYDIRHFVREKPNGAVLVVGDLNAGADFETIQQALDYLYACDVGDNEVPRRILITKHQVLEEPLQVRCNGVILEGVLNEVEPADAVGGEPEEDTEERVVLTWSHGGDTTPEEGAAINVNKAQDVTLQSLHFIRQESDTWCAINQPGDRFHLEDCLIGEQDADARIYVAVDFGEFDTNSVTVVGNSAHGLYSGLFGYSGATGSSVAFGTQGWLRRALVANNYVSIVEFEWKDGGGGDDWDDCYEYCKDCWNRKELPPDDKLGLYFYAIDCGVQPQMDNGCLFNTVQGNVINHCFNGIRVGRFSKVRSNAIHSCMVFGIVATAQGMEPELPTADEKELLGATEISGNAVLMGRYSSIPWLRTGIRLEMSTCYVGFNTVISGDPACGIVHGPLQLDNKGSIQAHFMALRDGCHAVVGNNVIMNSLDQKSFTINHGAAITREGLGIALFSVHNRVTDNGIFHARTGIVVTAYNVVANNVIEPAVVAIFAWAQNNVVGNTIGWFPHVSQGLPWQLDEYEQSDQTVGGGASSSLAAPPSSKVLTTALGAILLSYGNSCASNVIVCGAEDSAGANAAVAIYIHFWPELIFGTEWRKLFSAYWKDQSAVDLLLAGPLARAASGANIISSPVIQLAKHQGSTGSAGSFKMHGIFLNGQTAENTVTDAFIWGGLYGIYVQTGAALISGCTAWNTDWYALSVAGSQPVQMSGCAFMTEGNGTAIIGAAAAGSSFNDCLLIQQGFSSIKRAGWACLTIGADRVSVNDCAMLNYACNCIDWDGSYGVCGGCWFLAGDRQPQGAPVSGQTRFAAITFARNTNTSQSPNPDTYLYPDAATQANLVHGAHMLNCLPLGSDESVDSSPIEYSNMYKMYQPPTNFTSWNPEPPGYESTSGRWTNRVAVESCYFWLKPQVDG